MKHRAAACLLFLSLGAAGCAGPGRGASYPGAPVILISIDTLRSDHLPAYGYRKVVTPALDAFRREAILYARAYTHAPLTLPAHATIFTGRLPAGHGIRDNIGYTLSPAAETLAERLRKGGYRTGGAVSAAVLSPLSGISRGFDYYDDPGETTETGRQTVSQVQRAGGETASALESWIETARTRPGEPLFLFLHLYEPHTPYEPPEPWKSRFGDPYDGEIAAADAIVGDFIAFLRRKDLYDGALVIVLSDHGEGLDEHGEEEHGIFLYREVLQVPLLVKLPGGAHGGATVSSPVGLFDVAPTVLSLTGLASDGAASLPGRPLPLPGDPDLPPRRLFAESYYPLIHLGWSPLASLTDGRAHYIQAPRPEFYDLEKDPGEKHDLSADRPEGFRAFRAELEKLPSDFESPRAIDPEQARKLASLGYLTGGAASTPGPLPDPKDGLATLALLKEGKAALDAGRNAEAVKIFRRLLRANLRMQDVWDAYAQALFHLGRFDESLAAREEAAALSPPSDPKYFRGIADFCLVLGRPEEAEKYAKIALSRGEPAAHEILARIALRRGDFVAAESHAKEALAALPRSRLPYLALARVEIARGDYAKALADLEEAERRTSELRLAPLESLHYLRGETLGRMGRPEEAEKEFREELSRFPDNADAKASLALLYAAWGRGSDARLMIKALLAGNPGRDQLAMAAQISGVLGDTAQAEEYRQRAQQKAPSPPKPARGSPPAR
jgi:choline-sulfatase